MGKNDMNIVARIIYGLVGVAALITIIVFVGTPQNFLVMGLPNQILITLLTIGGLNWGLVAMTGDRDEDLFGILGL